MTGARAVTRATASVLAIQGVLFAGTTAPSAMFVEYRSVWGFSTSDLGLVFAVYVGTLLPVLLLFGGLADRIGRRPAIALGIGLALVGLCVFTVSSTVAGLVVARLFQGAGIGVASGALTAAVTETHRGRLPAGALSSMASSAGIFVGPLIVATAFDLGGNIHAVYLPLVVLTLACAALLGVLPARAASSAKAEEGAFDERVVARALAFALPVTFVSWAGFSLVLSLVPAYLAATLHANDPLVGAAVICAVQVASIAGTLRLRSLAPERAAVAAPVATVAGLAVLVAGTALHGLAAWVLVGLATVLVGGGGGVAFAATIALASRVARGQRARIFSRVFVASYLGFSLPSLTVGIIAARVSLTVGFGVAILTLAAVVATLPLLRSRAALFPVAT